MTQVNVLSFFTLLLFVAIAAATRIQLQGNQLASVQPAIERLNGTDLQDSTIVRQRTETDQRTGNAVASLQQARCSDWGPEYKELSGNIDGPGGGRWASDRATCQTIKETVGYCSFRQAKKYCPRSCNLCQQAGCNDWGPKHKLVEGNFEEHRAWQSVWATCQTIKETAGYCSSSVAKKYCPRSCNLCQQVSNSTAPPTAPPTPVHAGGRCPQTIKGYFLGACGTKTQVIAIGATALLLVVFGFILSR